MTDPVAPHRHGKPTPLMLHLGQAAGSLQNAVHLAPLAHDPRFPWHDSVAALGAALDLPHPSEIAVAGAHRLSQMLDGIETWQRHPWRRPDAEPPVIWSDGASRLLDYGQCAEATSPAGPPVLVIPSLINRAYILDLHADCSLLRSLAAQGYRPLLMDWGVPGEAEAGFTLEDYVSGRLRPALAIARVLAGRPVPVVGYCMGGTIGAALAANTPGDIRALVTIGAPWDFSQMIWTANTMATPLRADRGMTARHLLTVMAQTYGAIPDLLFQYLFTLLDTGLAQRKFRRFAALEPDSAEARHFVAVEDWLNDPVHVPLGVAQTVLVDWHLLNQTMTGDWSLLGRAVDLARVDMPVLSFCAPSDRIAPPASAEALPRGIRGADILRPSSGHVGMVTGRRAATELYAPLFSFLEGLT
ncbi:polyhydroxyalkanoate synthase [Rubricella aquisinus]|uniref:Polyhydroxyalkanoate synthase n=1 Tax=Rubricella aquisinus TaxID=2028108 RepID=A0A840WJB4_9RHOB|nr:alpha/beta fold hydrolase [Rubricella aquisinus]MBB5515179.1 polyhydroxyalkanoate synthase [Rubricella aquisinus]